MKRLALVGLIGVSVILALVPSAHAGHRRGPEVDVFFSFGPTYRYVPPPYYLYAPPPVVYSAPVVVPAPPPVYLPPPPPAQVYWHYCRSYGAYYPHVTTCPEPWLPVPAR